MIVHDSTVAYSTAKVSACKAALEKQIANGMFNVLPSPSPALLRRICQSGLGYEFTSPLAKRHIAKLP